MVDVFCCVLTVYVLLLFMYCTCYGPYLVEWKLLAKALYCVTWAIEMKNKMVWRVWPLHLCCLVTVDAISLIL